MHQLKIRDFSGEITFADEYYAYEIKRYDKQLPSFENPEEYEYETIQSDKPPIIPELRPLVIHIRSIKPTIRKARAICINVPKDIPFVIDLSRCFFAHPYLYDVSSFFFMFNYKIVSISSIFAGCSRLTDLRPLKQLDMRYVTDASHAFSNCTSLSDISPLRSWKFSSAETLENMFYHCGRITRIQDIRDWYVPEGCNLSGFWLTRHLAEFDNDNLPPSNSYIGVYWIDRYRNRHRRRRGTARPIIESDDEYEQND